MTNNIIPLIKESYLHVIINSVGAKSWQNYYAEVDGHKKDIVRRGQLSCAFFVSSILLIFGLIKRIHLTVAGTKKDLLSSGWRLVRNLQTGCVVVWEANKASNQHQHIGFCISKENAVSMNPQTGKPKVHSINYNQKRKIIEIYRHAKIK
jgi:hypothetical protein